VIIATDLIVSVFPRFGLNQFGVELA